MFVLLDNRFIKAIMPSSQMTFHAISTLGSVWAQMTMKRWHIATFPFFMMSQIAFLFVGFSTLTNETAVASRELRSIPFIPFPCAFRCSHPVWRVRFDKTIFIIGIQQIVLVEFFIIVLVFWKLIKTFVVKIGSDWLFLKS